MNDTIVMGNEEFILYVRKNYPANTVPNNQLGKRIWAWLQEQPSASAVKLQERRCPWGDAGPYVSETKLPGTATQFRFSRSVLPALYSFLDVLGQG